MKPSPFHRFLATFVALPLSISYAQDEPVTTPAVFHGYLKVDQLNSGNNGLNTATPAVAVQIVRKAGPATTTSADRGDYGINFGYENQFASGVLLSSVRENGRNNHAAGDPDVVVQSTSSAWPGGTGQAFLSAHSVADLAGTLYTDYDGGTGPSFDGGVAGNAFVNTARPVAGYRPILPEGTTVALGLSYSANITSVVRDWTGGVANDGLVVQTPRVGTSNAHTTDGWQICSSSYANINYRPKLTVEYLAAATGAQTFQFQKQDEPTGYKSTVDAVIYPTPAAATATLPKKTVDGSTVETEWIDADGVAAPNSTNMQGFFRFDNLTGPGNITAGAKVARAYLILTTNSSANSQTNGPPQVRQILKPWSLNTIPPVPPATTPVTTLVAAFNEDEITEASGTVGPVVAAVGSIGAYSEAWFDVTDSVQSWVNGTPNHGFQVSNTTDGWRIFFSGAKLPAVRPRLVVTTVPAGQEATPTVASFQNGIDSYTGAVERMVSSNASENRDGGTTNLLFMDGWNGTDSPQQAALMRFENIVGETTGAIPAGATVLKADLTLTSGTSANAQSGGPFTVARLLEPFLTASASTFSSEWNVDLAYAYFPFSEGWIGGLATNQGFLSTGELVDSLVDANGNYALDATGAKVSANNKQLVTLIGSPGLTIDNEKSATANFLDFGGQVSPTGNGYYQLFLDGVDASTDGVLLVGGGKNEANFAMSKPVTTALASGWEIVCHDNRSNGSAGENDAVAFVYVPLTAIAEGRAKALGRIMGDGTAVVQGGDFTVTNVANGRWLLKIAGGSNAKGTLIVSPEGRGSRSSMDEFGNPIESALFNIDNIVNYQWDDTLEGWIVESRDLPGAGLQTVDPDEGFFNFAYFEYPASSGDDSYAAWATAQGLDDTNRDPLLDADGDGLQNFAEHAFGTHPKNPDSSLATQVKLTNDAGAKQLGITFDRLTPTSQHYNYVVEFSADLKTWLPSATAVESTGVSTRADYQKVTVSDPIASGVDRRFVRVRLVYTP